MVSKTDMNLRPRKAVNTEPINKEKSQNNSSQQQRSQDRSENESAIPSLHNVASHPSNKRPRTLDISSSENEETETVVCVNFLHLIQHNFF